MRSSTLTALVFALGSTSLAPAESTTPELGIRTDPPRLEAFVGARVVIGPGRILEDATLLVRDGRIAAVGATVDVPVGARVHDLAGKTLYPGFVDPYTEYGLEKVGRLNPERKERSPKWEATRAGLDPWNDALHAHRSWVDEFVPDSGAADKLMARGVTTVQSGKRDGVFRGRAFIASVKSARPSEAIRRTHTSQWLSFDSGTSEQRYPSSLMGAIALTRQTLLDAEWYRSASAAGLDDPAEPDATLAALAGHDGGYLFETSDVLTLLRAGRIASELSLSAAYVASGSEYLWLDEVAELDATLIVTLGFPEAPEVGSYEDELDVTLKQLRHWELAPTNPAELERRGVRFALTGHGLDKKQKFFTQLRTAIERGLSADTALAALTTVPAELCGVADQVGTLEVGKRADLLIADGDLLTDSDARLLAVWIDGELSKQHHPDDTVGFEGVYALEIEGEPYELRLRGGDHELSGELEKADTTVDLEGVDVTDGQLRFRAPLDDLGGSGVARVTLADLDGDLWSRVHLADGRTPDAAAEKLSDELPDTEDADDADAEDEGEASEEGDSEGEQEEPAPVARRTRPNLPFGWETLPRAEDVLVRDATLWTASDAGVLYDADLLIVDGRIQEIGVDLEPPSGVRVIDGTGKHVTPGIIDEHSHIAASRGVNEGSHAVTAEVRVGDIINPESASIYRALAGGTTTAQILHGSANPIGGQAQIIKLRWGRGSEALKLADAPPTIKFALGENVKQSNVPRQSRDRYPQSRMGVEAILRDAFVEAREYEARWKDYRALSAGRRRQVAAPRRDLRLEAIVEVLNGERFVHCHSYVQSEILMLIRLAEEFGFRVQTFTHVLEGYKVAPELAAHGAGASTFSDWWAYKFEVYDAIPYNTCLLHEAGVVTSVNSDSGEVIRRLNQEAGKSVLYCGMEPAEALKLVTINPAVQLRIDDRVGSLEVGKDADFVIWNGPPLSMYSRAEQTWIEGVSYFDRERDQQLRERDRAERQALVQKLLGSGADGKKKKKKKKKEKKDGDSGLQAAAFVSGVEEVSRELSN